MTQVIYDWFLCTKSGGCYKFFHTEQQMTEERMWSVIKATEDAAISPDHAILFIGEGLEQSPYVQTTIRGRAYALVPFADMDELQCKPRTPAVQQLKLYDAISGACGES